MIKGFVRIIYLEKEGIDTNIPSDIIDLILLFFHLVAHEKFKHYNYKNYKLSNNDLTLTQIRRGYPSVCYGASEVNVL